MLGIGGGYIHEFGDDGVRIFDLFKNNSDIIRGFKFNGIGPYQDAANGKRYWMGGTTYINGTAEVQFPMPLVPESLGIRGAVFADAATLYGNDSSQGAVLRSTATTKASCFGRCQLDVGFSVRSAAL